MCKANSNFVRTLHWVHKLVGSLIFVSTEANAYFEFLWFHTKGESFLARSNKTSMVDLKMEAC